MVPSVPTMAYACTGSPMKKIWLGFAPGSSRAKLRELSGNNKASSPRMLSKSPSVAGRIIEAKKSMSAQQGEHAFVDSRGSTADVGHDQVVRRRELQPFQVVHLTNELSFAELHPPEKDGWN